MAVTVLHVSFVLLFSLFTLGVSGEPVACKTPGTAVHLVRGKTGSSDDYEFVTHVPQFQLRMCHQRCETYCKQEGPAGIEAWPNCKAFSSYVEAGGTCYCYGWVNAPSWYEDSNYNSGWCEN